MLTTGGLILLCGAAIGAIVAYVFVIQHVLPGEIERRFMESKETHSAGVTPPSPSGLADVPFGWLVGALHAMPLLAVLRVESAVVQPVAALVGVLLLSLCVVHDRLANARRAIKYVAFYVGGACIAVALPDRGWRHYRSGLFTWEDVVLAYFTVVLAMAIFAYMHWAVQPASPLERGDPSSARAIRWYRWTNRINPASRYGSLQFVILRAFPLLGDFYFAARIWTKARLARTPVLYLRSFGAKQAPAVLAKAIVPAVMRSAVIVALVHRRQASEALLKDVGEWWRVSTFWVPDEGWQDWFVERLGHALAVVVDATEMTDSLRWELETAVARLGGDHVVVLVPVGGSERFEECHVIEYSAATPDGAAVALDRWIRQITDEYEKPAGRASTRPLT